MTVDHVPVVAVQSSRDGIAFRCRDAFSILPTTCSNASRHHRWLSCVPTAPRVSENLTNRAADDPIEVGERVLNWMTWLVDRVAPPAIIADVNESTLSAVDAVRSYVVALREIRSRLFADLPGMTGVQDIMCAVRSQRTMAREGRTASGIEYSVHGAGCRMTDEDGREVDVDLIPDPHTTIELEAFDVWRIKFFLSSNGHPPLTNEELNAACEQLAGCGELRVVEPGRWFALPPSN